MQIILSRGTCIQFFFYSLDGLTETVFEKYVCTDAVKHTHSSI